MALIIRLGEIMLKHAITINKTCEINNTNLKTFLDHKLKSIENFLMNYNAILFDDIELKNIPLFLECLSEKNQIKKIIFKNYKQTIPDNILAKIPKWITEIQLTNCAESIYQSTVTYFKDVNPNLIINSGAENQPRAVEPKNPASVFASKTTPFTNPQSFLSYKSKKKSTQIKNPAYRIKQAEDSEQKLRSKTPHNCKSNFYFLLKALHTNLDNPILSKIILGNLLMNLKNLTGDQLEKFFGKVFDPIFLKYFEEIKDNLALNTMFQELNLEDQINYLVHAIEKDISSQITWLLTNIKSTIPDNKLYQVSQLFLIRMFTPNAESCFHLVKFMETICTEKIRNEILNYLSENRLLPSYLVQQLIENQVPFNKNIAITVATKEDIAIKNLIRNDNSNLSLENQDTAPSLSL